MLVNEVRNQPVRCNRGVLRFDPLGVGCALCEGGLVQLPKGAARRPRDEQEEPAKRGPPKEAAPPVRPQTLLDKLALGRIDVILPRSEPPFSLTEGQAGEEVVALLALARGIVGHPTILGLVA